MGIETASATTYKSTLEHFSEVIVGNENSSKFEPHIRLKKWGEESYLAFGVPTGKNIQASFDGNLIEWIDSDANRKYRFYEHAKSEQQEHGGFEYEIILGAPPDSESIEFPCNLTGLDLQYQGELSVEEIKKGNTRPENVVGSYAAYHTTKTVLHGKPGDADKYRCGKAFHIFRPFATDANGDKKWLDFLFDRGGITLRLVLDVDWFANAAYPVVIDPSIGYTTLGASTDATGLYANANSYTAGTTGTANPGTAYYGGNTAVGTATVYVGAYDFGDGNISGNNRLAVSSAITLTTTAGYRSAAITWTGITSGTAYYIEGYSNTAGVSTKYDTGLTAEYTNTAGGAASPPDPHVTRSGTSANNKMSIYVDYTASGTGSLFRRNGLNGLGTGGPFFKDPLGVN